MSTPTRALRTTGLLAAGLLTASLVAGCSDDTDPTSDAQDAGVSVETHQASVDLLPESVRSAGTIQIVMDATQGKPFTYFEDEDEKMSGITADVADAVAGTLGLEPEYHNVPFDGLITGLEAQRYDLSVAPMLMTEERLTKVDQIGFLKGGSRFLVMKDSEYTSLTLEDTCGLRVGATTGSVEAAALTEQSQKCTAAGQAPVDVKLFPRTSEGIVALTSGRLDAFDSASAQTGYIAAQDGQLTASGDPYNSGVSSMALQKDSELSAAVESALQHLIDEGAYGKILDKYGVTDLAVPSASLNKPAT